jgi:shikimate dehydrogenase
MNIISKDTKIFLSCSAKPGNFGATVYNNLFSKYKIDGIYLPRFCVDPSGLINSIRLLNCSGCSVSMPLKNSIIPYLDNLSKLAEEASSVNTITNAGGKLTGHNTDIFGVRSVLAKQALKRAVIFGSGSVVDSIVVALNSLGIIDISILARNNNEAKLKCLKYKIHHLEDTSYAFHEWDIFINATPAPFDETMSTLYSRSNSVFDLVVSPFKTDLIKQAESDGKVFIQGVEMAIYQLQAQFKLYTNFEPSLSDISEAMSGFLKKGD